MKIFIDTAKFEEIQQARDLGLIDGVTTNPSLLAKEKGDWKKLAERICKEVDGPVSVEVLGLAPREMIREALDLVKLGPNVVVKIPVTLAGIEAIRELSLQGVATNATLVFSAVQALLAAKAGASYVSPFVGRLDASGQNGMEVVEQIVRIFKIHGLQTQVLTASVRHPMHVLQAALLGAHAATLPFAVILELLKHPLTDLGLERFLKDWNSRTD